ncbi:GNAT family N-acetyltransferase [Mesorhizobium sp. SP-1A]|uniref:GNAT family N-acetyltransferase n=1 Tax=Mesorhizobium sp. SP-1A TaxID=3077840 RepID=UPI0028F72162|nr:GNAT family N-acetyltransferase [Mesorhizobium sp. SP-1A]
MEEKIVDNHSMNRFELPVGDATAVAYYRIENGRVVLVHTEVPQELSGQGIGTRLAKGVFEAIRASGRRVIAKCPFMAAFASRHPEYLDMVDG